MSPRQRKSSELKALQGNPGHRAIPNSAPRFTPGVPPRPDWLGDVARAEWDRIAPELDAKGTLTVVDQTALAGYCLMVEELGEHTETLRREGRFYKPNPNSGMLREHPASKARRECLMRLGSYMAMLGMTPADRSRVTAVEKKKPEGKLEALLRSRG